MRKFYKWAKQDECNDRLRELRAQFNLTRVELVRLTGYSGTAVDSWLARASSTWAKKAPARMVRLLEFELGLGAPNPQFNEIRERAA